MIAKDDPRRIGGRYWSGYWQSVYTVTGIDDRHGWWGERLLTVQWPDGHSTTHSTPWDERRDRVVSEPAVAG